jgi:outer membrane receptor protein involved in Fe transport
LASTQDLDMRTTTAAPLRARPFAARVYGGAVAPIDSIAPPAPPDKLAGSPPDPVSWTEAGRRLGHDLYCLSLLPVQPGWALPLREGFLQARAAGRHRRPAEDRWLRKWLQLRLGAWSRGHHFDPALDCETLRQLDTDICPVTLERLTHATRRETDASVDRLDNSRGYTLHNLAVMSLRANRAKADMSLQEVLRRAGDGVASRGLSPAQWQRLGALMLARGQQATPAQAQPAPAGLPRLAHQPVQPHLASARRPSGAPPLRSARPARRVGRSFTAVVAALLLGAGSAYGAADAAAPDTASAVAQLQDPALLLAGRSVEQVLVKGQTLRTQAAPYSATTIDAQQVRDAAVTQPEELLRQVPGVVVRSLSLGGVVNSVTIRGFSGGAHGGDLGMVLDGVPLNEAMSHADGYADLNVVVPLEIDRLVVHRGPVSALYGNFNRGGVLALETRQGGRYAQGDLSAGSFGTVDAQAALGAPLLGGHFNGAVQLYRTQGFRPGFGYERGTLAGRWSVALAPQTRLSLSARGHRGDWDSAGNVTKEQFEGPDPRGRDPRVVDDGGYKRYANARVDLSQGLGADLRLLVFAYGNRQDYTRYFTRPVSTTTWSQREETYDRGVGGAGFSFNGDSALVGQRLRWTAGAELYRERTDFLNHEGTVARQRVNAAVYDRRFRFDSQGVFGEAELDLAPWLRPTLGLRWDRFSGECTRRGPETGADACGPLNTVSRATPKLGLRSTVARGLDLRASVAEGFALPPGAVKYSAGAAGLAPTVLKQTELGLSWAPASWLRTDLAVYRIDSSDEVRTVAPGVFENFGSTRRDGVEASLAARAATHLEFDAVYSRTAARVRAHANPALVGKRITGVPVDSATLGIAWRPPAGLGGGVELRHVGELQVNAANTVVYPGYTTVGLALSYAGEAGAGRRWRAYAKVENAGDRLYATSTGLGGGVQTFNVAAPRGLRIGVQTDL